MVLASHSELGERLLYCEGDVPLLFTENETNNQRLFGTANRTKYVKDGINNYVVNRQAEAVNSAAIGTKVSAHYEVTIGAGESQTFRLRLTEAVSCSRFNKERSRPLLGDAFDAVMEARQKEADEFYATVIPCSLSADAANLMRQR